MLQESAPACDSGVCHNRGVMGYQTVEPSGPVWANAIAAIERLKEMKALRRCMGLGVTILAVFVGRSVMAQENIDAGKTPAELYAQDCAICHKTPHGLSKGGGIFGLQSFLRVHYTASKESAAAIAAYLTAIDRGAVPNERARAATKHLSKGEKAKIGSEKSKKIGEAKSAGPKSDKQKSEEAKLPPPKGEKAKIGSEKSKKMGEAKSAEPKSDKQKSEEAKLPPAKPSAAKSQAKADSDVKPEHKPPETKSSAANPSENKPVEAKADAKANSAKPASDTTPEKKSD
jgi:hypothetical protein